MQIQREGDLEIRLQEIRHRLDYAASWVERWRATLDYAKLRPSMFIGGVNVAHKHTIQYPLDLVWKTEAFSRPRATKIICSPTEYIIACDSGPLAPGIVELVDWTQPVLIDAFRTLRERLYVMPRESVVCQHNIMSASGPNMEMVLQPAYLAEKFVIAISTTSGYWLQSFRQGWPTDKPQLLNITTPIGLFLFGSLSKKWFTGLPFNVEVVKHLVPWEAQNSALIQWTQDVVSTAAHDFPRDFLA